MKPISIALESKNTTDHQIEGPGIVHGLAFAPIYKSPDLGVDEDDRTSSSSSSSIGRNSDDSLAAGGSSSDGGHRDGDGDGEEVQSPFKPGALDNLESLEEVLPIKRGISSFYAGKSKSYTSLADAASCSSLKDMVKPENAYTRKRKNLLAQSNFFDKNRNRFPRNSSGLYKRPINSRSSLALGATSSCSESNNSSESLNSNASSPCFSLPPLPPQSRRYSIELSSSPPPELKLSGWRSFSLSDLQGAATGTPSLMGIKEQDIST